MILAIDLGTTHWKAALITDSGEISRVSRIPTPVVFEDGFPCYAAEAVKQHLRELLANLGPLPPLSAVALTGMAEAGLLVERGTLRPLSSVWPWFDRRALPVFESTRGDFRFADRPAVTGLPDSYKYGIYKLLTLMKTGKYDPDRTAVAMGKYIGDCRLTHYGALLRKALDDAGYPQVPIITNDTEDVRNMHPGYKMNLDGASRIAFTMPVIDAMEELLRKIRPYEVFKGSADKAFERGMDNIIRGLEEDGVRGMHRGFRRAIQIMKTVRYDRSVLKPRVLIVGEYLLNFHPGANREIERYLESNGMEIVEARMTDVIRKTYFYKDAQNREYHLKKKLGEKGLFAVENRIFDLAHDMCDRIACEHPLYEKATRMEDLVKVSDKVIHHTFDAGEGVLIPGEILHNAAKGCRNFLILQPFGCLPNHVVGRGIMKKLREIYPDVQILALDYDPDISTANIENRLQMLIMNAKAAELAAVQ